MPDAPPIVATPPEPQPLARVFDHLYLSADESFWQLAPAERSKEALRRVFAVAKSCLPPRLPLDFAPGRRQSIRHRGGVW
jgi:hypothetical protein